MIVLAVSLGAAGEAAASAPTASFRMSTAVTPVGEPVTFTDTSTDPDGDLVNRGWDINGDGVITDPSGSRVVSRAYDTPGQVTILLRVRDAAGNVDTATQVLTVVPRGTPVPAPEPSPPPAPAPSLQPLTPNRAPDAAFSFSPGAPETGETVLFTSSSGDPDGNVASQLWDLDGDGQFDDAGGGTAQTVFTAPGPHTVSLSVTDDRGKAAVAFQTVDVRDRAVTAASPPSVQAGGGPAAAPVALPPLPVVVRIRGQVLKTTVRVQVLAVTAPRGASVVVICRPARRCGRGRTAVEIGPRGRTVRFRRLQRRLRAGTVIEVAVTRAGRIGKWTRFVIRRGTVPSRKDLCLRRPGGRPMRCPVD